MKTIIQVTSYRHSLKGQHIFIKQPAIRYYMTQGEDASRIRVQPLPNNFALARNLALNLYRDYGFDNMAQAQRKAGQGLQFLKSLFRIK